MKSLDIGERKRELVLYLVNILNIEKWQHNYVFIALNNCVDLIPK